MKSKSFRYVNTNYVAPADDDTAGGTGDGTETASLVAAGALNLAGLPLYAAAAASETDPKASTKVFNLPTGTTSDANGNYRFDELPTFVYVDNVVREADKDNAAAVASFGRRSGLLRQLRRNRQGH